MTVKEVRRASSTFVPSPHTQTRRRLDTYRTGELEKANGRVGKTPRTWLKAESREMSACIRMLLAVRRWHGTYVASKQQGEG
jgi:hypothetical protein